MSVVSHPAAAIPGRAVARLRTVRDELEYSRSKRLRASLRTTVAVFATLGPLVLAATNGLRPIGVHAAGSTPQTLVLVALIGIAAPLASMRMSVMRVLALGV